MQSLNLIPERNAMPEKGASFSREAGEVLFQFVIDAGNIVGPRPATKLDSERYPLEWAQFVAGETPPAPKPGPVEIRPPAAPETVVQEKDLSAYEALIEPKPKRAYARRKVA